MRLKYEEWLNEWLVLYVKPTTKERTYKKYFKLAETHSIIPPLGGYDLHELSPTVLQKFTVRLSDNGFSANTVNGIISVLKSSLKRAVALGIAEKEYTDCIVRPKQREKQVVFFYDKTVGKGIPFPDCPTCTTARYVRRKRRCKQLKLSRKYLFNRSARFNFSTIPRA